MTQITHDRTTAEKSRSAFRHDIRTSFNVLIGYTEICLEDFDEVKNSATDNLKAMLEEIRFLLRDTEYAIEKISIESEEFFKLNLASWLKEYAIPSIQKIAKIRKSIERDLIENENKKNMDLALKRLTKHCLNPFADSALGVRLLQTQSTKETIQTEDSENYIGRVLLVDDEWHNLAILRHKLERLRFNVTALTSPLAALRFVAENAYDVVLVDLNMPEISGLDFLRAMSADPKTAEIPVLIITASDEVELLSECINKGAVDFLPKPVDASILKARMHSCLERKRNRDRERTMSAELLFEKARADELLTMIIPRDTISELKDTGSVKPRKYSNVSVMFCDVVNFTSYCENHSPEEVIDHLHSLFSEFDAISEIYGLQKIKTIGDSYMVAGGLLRPLQDALVSSIHAGLEMIDAAASHPSGWQVRVGIHCGDVISGIIGTRQFLYDLWGDTVNTASRIESSGKPMSVTMLRDVVPKDLQNCELESLGHVKLKGKGLFGLTAVRRRKS